MNVVAIPPGHVGMLWGELSKGIQRMLDKGTGTHTAQEIRDKAQDGEWLLFAVEDDQTIISVIVCSITQGDRKVFEIGMAWGSQMEDWLDDIDETLTRVARELGCDSMVISGRRGWVRKLRDRGFSERLVTVVRDLDG